MKETGTANSVQVRTLSPWAWGLQAPCLLNSPLWP